MFDLFYKLLTTTRPKIQRAGVVSRLKNKRRLDHVSGPMFVENNQKKNEPHSGSI